MTTNCLEVLLEAAVFMSTQAGRSGSENLFRCPKSPASPEFQSLRSLERNGRSEARLPFDTYCAAESKPEEAFPSRFGQKSRNILLGLGFDQAQLAVRSLVDDVDALGRDRKSTRLNSSHGYISYAVFCLKKKKNSSIDVI